MKKPFFRLIFLFITLFTHVQAQDRVVDKIVQEANDHSQLECLAHELLDRIGPRLVGSSKMKQAHDWTMQKYQFR